MKEVLILLLSVFCIASVADLPPADYVQGERSTDAITPEAAGLAATMIGARAASNLLHAARLAMTQYDMDMRTSAGRVRWHGKLVKEIVYTNDLVKVSVYSNSVDGAIWRYREPFHVRGVVKPPAPRLTSSGVPARLAAARARRAAEANTVSNVTVTVEANSP